MAPILTAGLPKMGVCRNFARDIVFSTMKCQGLEIKDPYVWQYLQHIKTSLKEGTSNSITQELLQSTIEQFRLETGFYGKLTRIPDDLFKVTNTRTWIGETIFS